jgi:cytochrome c biogenesis protein CcdA/glutaredoxin
LYVDLDQFVLSVLPTILLSHHHSCEHRSLGSASTLIRIRLLLLVLFLVLPGAVVHAEVGQPVDLAFFYGRGCPHCAAMKQFLQTMEEKHPQLRVHEYEVYFDDNNARLFERVADAYHFQITGVPTIFLGEDAVTGFSEDAAPELEQKIERCIAQGCGSPLDRTAGAARARTLTFPAVVFGAAVDAINPCAFAVLIILITTILGAGTRRKALAAGLAFSLSIFISYYLMGLGLYSAVAAAGLTQAIYIAVAVLAIIVGLFNLKDYLWYGRWFVMEVPLTWRPALKGLIQSVTSVPGAFLVGFAVSLFLLPCTSGPYIVILGLLAKTASRPSAMLWLLLYNAVFTLPMILITVAVYLGITTLEKAERWRTRHLQLLHLISGIILLLLGLGMLTSLWVGWI